MYLLMVNMICCRSSLNMVRRYWLERNLPSYRHGKWGALIGCLGVWLAVSISLVGRAADTDDWPDPIEFHPALMRPPVVNPVLPQNGNISGSTGQDLQKLEGSRKGIWPFRRDKKEKKDQKPPTEAQIVRVGPKDPPAYPDPLLRLSFPIHTEQGILQPGYYLVRQLKQSAQERTLALTRQHQTVLEFNVSAVADEPASPIQPVDRTALPKVSVEILLSPDKKTLTVLLKEGNKRYESQAFPVATDTRRKLAF
jgi:hypothetical protein